MPQMKKSKGHIECIDGFEYFKVDGRLYRAPIDKPLENGKRAGQFVTTGSGVELALRLARLQAGKSERWRLAEFSLGGKMRRDDRALPPNGACAMNVDELKAKVEAHRESLKTKTGICHFSPSGPVGISVIDAIVTTLEAQQRRIDELEKRLKG